MYLCFNPRRLAKFSMGKKKLAVKASVLGKLIGGGDDEWVLRG